MGVVGVVRIGVLRECCGEFCLCRIDELYVLLCTFRFSRKHMHRQRNGANHKFKGKFNESQVEHFENYNKFIVIFKSM